MATTADYLAQLQKDKQSLVDNLVAKGINASSDETFTTLIPKVNDISDGGSDGEEITKGLVFSDYDSDGYPTKIEIRGMTEIPTYYMSYFGYSSSNVTINFLKNFDTLIIPEGVISIGSNAFDNNTWVKNITLPSTLQNINSMCVSNLKITELEVPQNVTEIPTNSLRNNRACTKVTLNGDITSIGDYAFYYYQKLEQFIMPNITSVPTLTATSAFSSGGISSGTGYIYVPDELVEEMKVATNWSTYADQIKGVSELV